MKLLLLGSLLLGGGGVAATNETVQQDVTKAYEQVKTMVQKGFRGSMVDRVKETGFPYPNEALLDQLTEEQEAIYVTTIDQINAEYDWANMTDEEITAALALVKDELTALREEFGVEVQAIQSRQGKHWNEDFVSKGQQKNGGQTGRANQQSGGFDGECPLDETDTTTDDGLSS